MTPDSVPYAIQVTAVDPTLQEPKSLAEKMDQSGTHVSGLEAADEQRGQWGASLFGCFSSCVPNCCLISFCPCISLAQIDARLGGSFEMAVMGFGTLVTGLLVCGGLLVSSIQDSDDTDVSHSGPDLDVDSVVINGYHPTKRSVPSEMVVAVAVVVAMVLVVAVVRLRHMTRKQLTLAGSTAQDLALTLACCPCVVAQMATQLETYTPDDCSLSPAIEDERRHHERDVLPAYMVTPHT